MSCAKNRAGILLYRNTDNSLEVLLALPAGPKNKNNKWEIPKGKIEVGEDIFEGAKREFKEETGITPEGKFVSLGSAPHNKTDTTHIWALKGDWKPEDGHTSITYIREYPPNSGKLREFPEVEKIDFFLTDDARSKILPKQRIFIERLRDKVFSLIVINEDEPYQRAVEKKHRKMKMRLVGLGGNKKKEKGHEKPSYKRSKSAPPGAGGT
jgi:predicted NUDIX family NTP pyrophosphohydrolase